MAEGALKITLGKEMVTKAEVQTVDEFCLLVCLHSSLAQHDDQEIVMSV